MQQIPCLNYCEILSQMGDTKEQFEKSLSQSLQKAGFSYCHRLYIGSYFCSKYFVGITEKQIQIVKECCKEKDINITLVLPIFSQQNLELGKEKVEQFINHFASLVNEITVNDFGMLQFIYENYIKEHNERKLTLGRLLMKDYRDPRYEEYFNHPLQPKIFTEYLDELRLNYKVQGLEFDPTHKKIDLSQCPNDIEVGIHVPYCYMTVGQICEFSSIPKIIEKKFRPNTSCDHECMTHMVHYIMEDQRMWIRLGRAVYFENKDWTIKGVDSLKVIYFPAEWEAKHECISTVE